MPETRSSGVRSGLRCSMSATTPATCGEAMLVPEAVAVPSTSDETAMPVRAAVETMLVPGALTLG